MLVRAIAILHALVRFVRLLVGRRNCGCAGHPNVDDDIRRCQLLRRRSMPCLTPCCVPFFSPKPAAVHADAFHEEHLGVAALSRVATYLSRRSTPALVIDHPDASVFIIEPRAFITVVEAYRANVG